jgi:hypothetical protein
MTTTTHNFQDIGKLVKDHKLDILNYYPYGPKTEWSYWLCGTGDLRKEYKDKRHKGRTEKDYIISILNEVGRAMHYLTVYGEWSAFDPQRLNAFALYHLFSIGEHGWTKDNVNLPTKKLTKHIAFHKDLIDQIHGSGKYDSKERQIYEKERLKVMTKEERTNYDQLMKNSEANRRKELGIYEVKYPPLIGSFPNRKIFYTKQQLAAIELMVVCEFENLC